MNPEEIYRKWKKKRTDITIPPDFTDQVMKHINKLEQEKGKLLFNAEILLACISSCRLAKIGLIAASIAIGLFRTALVLLVFLG